MDTFIVNIVNALPDAIVTAIITGVFVYLIQKRIESSYNTKLEEFKAQLQSSYFEHQTKFVRNHQKEVETLETLYQKFMTFADDFSDDMLECLNFGLPSKKIIKVEVSNFNSYRYDKHYADLEECKTYFNSNRLFLSADVRNEIDTIIKVTFLISMAIPLVLLNIQEDKVDANFIKTLNEFASNLGVAKVSVRKPNLALFLHHLVQQTSLHKRTIEDLYKSVTGIKTK